MKIVFSFLKSLPKFFLVLTVTFGCLSMTWNYYGLLSEEDHSRENFDRQHAPALSSALDSDFYWESFNKWQCFSTHNVEFECSELDYGVQYVPTIRVSYDKELYDFSLDPESGLSCQEILNEWNDLLEYEDSFCVYAAYLQDLPHTSFELEGIRHWSLWIVDQIKSRKGYWKEWDLTVGEEPPASADTSY